MLAIYLSIIILALGWYLVSSFIYGIKIGQMGLDHPAFLFDIGVLLFFVWTVYLWCDALSIKISIMAG